MADKVIGVPTVKGIGSSLKDFGIGALGGLVYLLATQIFGPLGVLAAPLLAGSMIKGNRGEVIAVMAGFMLLAMGASAAASSGSNASQEYM